MRYLLLGVLAAFPLCAPLGAQDHGDRSDLSVVGRIKTEAFENSQVMDTLWYLTDQYGPRLTASPQFQEAAEWTVKRLQGYGIENVRLEKWGPFGRSWSLKQYSVEMLEPRYSMLVAAPLAWSDNTHGHQTGEILLTPYGSGRRVLDPKKAEDELDKYMAEWKGKLKGKIILLSAARPVEPATTVLFERDTDKELSEMAVAPEPSSKVPVDLKQLKFPDDPQELRRYYSSLPSTVTEELFNRRQTLNNKRAKFFKRRRCGGHTE